MIWISLHTLSVCLLVMVAGTKLCAKRALQSSSSLFSGVVVVVVVAWMATTPQQVDRVAAEVDVAAAPAAGVAHRIARTLPAAL